MADKSFGALSLLGCVLVATAASANDDRASGRKEDPVVRESPTAMETPPSRDVILNNGEYGGKMGRIPPGTKARKYRIDTQGQTQQVQALSTRATSKVIYSNTNTLEPLPGGGRVGAVWAMGAGARIADDMTTQAVNPCELTEIVVDVHGGNLDPEDLDPGEFGVTLQLWDGCPNGGGSLLTDSSGVSLPPFTFSGLLNNEVSHLSIILPPGTIPPSTTIWVSGIFDTDFVDNLHIGAGFIVGTPPERGFSKDGVDTPIFVCDARFGTGWPEFLHASIAAKMFAVDACETHFFAYLAENNSKETFDLGRSIRIAEDITLTIDDCELSTYEIGLIGQARDFQLQADLRTGPITGPTPQPLGVIPGTQGVFLGHGLDEVEVAKFAFPPGIAIPQELWVTWRVNKRNTGAILTQDTEIGTGTDVFAFEDPFVGKCTLSGAPCRDDSDCLSGEFCNFWTTENFPGPKTGIFYVAVRCRGEAPTGACCRFPDEADPPGGACVDGVPAADCARGRWARDATCADVPAPFDPPCGTAACCIESNVGASSTCRNLSKSECDVAGDCTGSQCLDQPGIWQPGEFCGKQHQACFAFACYYANDVNAQCTTTHPAATACIDDADCRPEDGWHWGCNQSMSRCAYPVGCDSIRCCDIVCGDPSFEQCCDPGVGWEFHCAQQAQNSCLLPPVNDKCFDPDDPDNHATAIHMAPDGSGGLHAFVAASDLGVALWDWQSDPGLCCNNAGVNEPAASSEWFVVESTGMSTRITTCDSDEQFGQDTIIQVFSPASPGDLATECTDLISLACSEDSGCGMDGSLSDICISGIPAGDPIYIMLASGVSLAEPGYVLTIQQPCPTPHVEPDYTRCSDARIVPTGVEEVVFACPADSDGVCLEGTSLTCEGLDETIDCFDAMKNDVWIDYTPDCTGLLRIETCEKPPLASPATTLAVYGNPIDGGPLCPDEGALLLDCNDDARVNAEEHEVRPQECTLGRDVCITDDECVFPEEYCVGGVCITSCVGSGTCPRPDQVCVKVCSVSGGVCTTASDCPVGESCEFDECVRPCDTDADCPLAACSVGKDFCDDDNDCDVGLCSWDRQRVCDVSAGDCPAVCRFQPGTVCDRFAGPGEPGSCPVGTGPCIAQSCRRTESCDGEVCASECWPGSAVRVPVAEGSIYKVRLGGEYGSAPEGSLKFKCQPRDCSGNLIPDICEISCDAMNGACQLWAGRGCGTAEDCNENTVPDECEIRDDPSLDVLPPGGNGVLDSCETYCPEGPMEFTKPTSPMSDAGQPHPIDDAGMAEGYSKFLATGPGEATDVGCWSLTETDAGQCGNAISSVAETAPRDYEITLDRPLQTASVTTITYDWGTGSSSGVFTALPGDVDGSRQTNAADIRALIDCLSIGPCAKWQCDIDRLGGCTGADLERLIDLLNDAGAYSGWEGATPADVACPPS